MADKIEKPCKTPGCNNAAGRTGYCTDCWSKRVSAGWRAKAAKKIQAEQPPKAFVVADQIDAGSADQIVITGDAALIIGALLDKHRRDGGDKARYAQLIGEQFLGAGTTVTARSMRLMIVAVGALELLNSPRRWRYN
jgi:hypothetical protein